MAVDGTRVDPLGGSPTSATIYTVRCRSGVGLAMSLPSTSSGRGWTPLVLHPKPHRCLHWGVWVSVHHGVSMTLRVTLTTRGALSGSKWQEQQVLQGTADRRQREILCASAVGTPGYYEPPVLAARRGFARARKVFVREHFPAEDRESLAFDCAVREEIGQICDDRCDSDARVLETD